ncbi:MULTISPECIES: inorganic phosphate transporter [unclassified Neisseria]|uniref:inorganic phosphate transporter n=1 Tax=unclassified Neisseria TaxID=2623750 RepID=UPI002664E5AF|nr:MULTISPECIES: inorganic phosphate transporter [unclassified Neisseria]MDO1510941.1 anion permease [Neisseria sp. MVDL19-042950]MDO1517219.1 anion permease [Neisseria sp. MVDL18-041461]MDO1564582.1 anion permease [Neisseria sp. MVDL20-010259]
MAQTPTSSSIQKINFIFTALLIGMVGYFIVWGLGYTQHNHVVLFLLATLFGVFMAFNIGGNDVANSFGTSVGAGTLTIPQALLIAAIFEVSGAVIAGGQVTDTIRKGIIDLNGMEPEPMQFVYIMMSALLAAALWLLFASRKGLPVSTTHAIIGGIVGSALCLGFVSGNDDTFALVQWKNVAEIAVSWVLSPVLGGLVSYLLFSQIKRHVLDYNTDAEERLKRIKQEKKTYKEQHRLYFESLDESEKIECASAMARDAQIYGEGDFDPSELESSYYRGLYDIDNRKHNIDAYKALHSWVPLIASAGGMMIAAMLIFKGLKNLELGMTNVGSFLTIFMIGAAIWMATFIYAKTLKRKDLGKSTFLMFSWMQVFTAAGFAFSHGANDIANAIGPFAAIMDVLRTNDIGAQAPVPPVAMLTFGIALVVGLWFIGKEVIQTVGTSLAEMHPSSGFTAELAAASVVMMASLMGLPVSSTHILVGAVLGIGLVNRNANWALMKPIGLAWVITLPAAAVLSVGCFLALRAVFG